MKNIAILMIVFLALLTSCTNSLKGEGDADLAQDYKIEAFDAVHAEGKFKLVLIPNDSAYVSVQTHKNLIENMDIFVQNKTLNLAEKESVDSFESYVVYLYYNQNIEEINLAHKVLMESSTNLPFEDIAIHTQDEAMIQQFVINAKEAEISVFDKSEIELKGEITALDLKAKDYARVAVEQTQVKVLDVDLSGEAEVLANVSKELKGRVLENSTLKYLGNPQKDVDVKDNGEILNQ